MKLEEQIRQIARSRYWQEIYNASKSCSGIYLFENHSNFSGIQSLFLYWLKVYSMLYDEFAQLRWENLDKKIIKDNDRCDAFLYWRSKQIEKDIRKSKREEKKARRKSGKTMKIFSGEKLKKVKNNGD
jgi:hypothetical protein